MKLLTKINLRFLLVTLLLFAITGVFMYFILGFVATDNLDEILESRIEKVKQSLSEDTNVVFSNHSLDQSVIVEKVTKTQMFHYYSDTTIYDSFEEENVEYRKLTEFTKINTEYFKIQLIIARFETEDLVELIFYSMLGLFGLIAIILFMFNRWFVNSLWSPFFNTLKRLKEFSIEQQEKVVFETSDIFEFNQLNAVLEEMTEKIQTDFRNLKEFSENASHEIQTPLAIIKSKLENMLQNKQLSEEMQNQIKITHITVSRLSKLNESLLLLSKIENQQFTSQPEVNLCDLLIKKIEFIKELMELKNISISVDLKTPFVVFINLYLAETLINNLLSNAIKHNFSNGEIKVTSFKDKIVFANTGTPLKIPPEKIFQRFFKDSSLNESTGLGLSIVLEICKSNKLQIFYEYYSGFHVFTIQGFHKDRSIYTQPPWNFVK